MRNATERRFQIIEKLCERRHISIARLATEFSVHRRTIERDLEVLSTLFPIYTTMGNSGGIHVLDGYQLGMKYLTEPQAVLLEKISATLTGEDLILMREILKTFKKLS